MNEMFLWVLFAYVSILNKYSWFWHQAISLWVIFIQDVRNINMKHLKPLDSVMNTAFRVNQSPCLSERHAVYNRFAWSHRRIGFQTFDIWLVLDWLIWRHIIHGQGWYSWKNAGSAVIFLATLSTFWILNRQLEVPWLVKETRSHQGQNKKTVVTFLDTSVSDIGMPPLNTVQGSSDNKSWKHIYHVTSMESFLQVLVYEIWYIDHDN